MLYIQVTMLKKKAEYVTAQPTLFSLLQILRVKNVNSPN